MTGIEILAKEPIYELWNGAFYIAIGLLVMSVVIGVIMIIKLGCADGLVLIFVCICVSCIIFTSIGMLTQQPTERYKYKVTIDDSVNFNEFSEKYEIVDQEGKIYTIQEREYGVEHGND